VTLAGIEEEDETANKWQREGIAGKWKREEEGPGDR
jgi:hypothetical protein